MKRLRGIAAATAACCSLSSTLVLADETPPDAVIVTATRTAVTADDTLAAVTVLSRQDIEQSQAKSVAELINGLPGVEIITTGGYGTVTSLFLRGTNDSHVIVLVDGMRLGSATLGTYSWEFLPVDQIDHIEIVRGPRSSLYGPDAIGGVIQIFTRKGKDGVHAGVSAGAGTFDSSDVSANVSGAVDGTHYSVAASRFATDNINARNPAPEFSGGSNYSEPDKDGMRNNSASARVGHRFGGGAEIDAHLLHTQGHNKYDGSFVNESDFIQNAVGTDVKFMPTRFWNVKLQGGRTRDETDNFKDGTYSSTFNTIRRSRSWQNDFAVADKQLFTVGVDYQKELIESSSAYAANAHIDKGYFVQHQAGFGAHDVTLGVRRDDTYGYGAQDTGNVAWGYAISGEALRVLASYGTAFKAPTFNQLYDPFVGNPNIQPERSKSYELGLRGKTSMTTWATRAFETDVDDLIVFEPPTYQAINLNRARIRGLENELAIKQGNNRAGASLTFLDPRDAQTGALLPRRAKRSFRLDDEYVMGLWHLGATWLIQSYRYDDPQNTTRLGGYGLLDLRAQYDVAKNWFIKVRVGNATDKTYVTAANYNNPGRNYFLTVGYQYQ